LKLILSVVSKFQKKFDYVCDLTIFQTEFLFIYYLL